MSQANEVTKTIAILVVIFTGYCKKNCSCLNCPSRIQAGFANM
jgi:hypothetical protein